MFLFAILVTTVLARHIPDHHPPGPPPPEFLRNLTHEAQREFFDIIHDDILTFAEIDEKATKWASENNVTDAFASFQQEHKKLEEQENQNVTKAIEKLKTIQAQINDVLNNKNQTREDEHDAIEKLRRRNPWEVDTVLHIRRPPPPPRDEDQDEGRDTFPFPVFESVDRVDNQVQTTFQLNGLGDALRQQGYGQFGYGNYFNQQRGDFQQRGQQNGGFQLRPMGDFEQRGPHGGDFQQRPRDGFEPRGSQRGEFQPRRHDDFEPREGQRGDFQSIPRDNFEQRGQHGSDYQPRTHDAFDRRGPQRGEFQPRPYDDFKPRGQHQGDFQPRPRDGFEQRGPQRGEYQQRSYDDFQQREPHGSDFQQRSYDDFVPRGQQRGDFQQNMEYQQWNELPRQNLYQPDFPRQKFGQNYNTITDDEMARIL